MAKNSFVVEVTFKEAVTCISQITLKTKWMTSWYIQDLFKIPLNSIFLLKKHIKATHKIQIFIEVSS